MNKLQKNGTRNLKEDLRSQSLGLFMGIAFTCCVSFIVWLFAYFGYINLGLPQRYDYEKTDHIIKQNIPTGYEYRSVPIDNFRQSDTKSILVIASDKDTWGPDYSKHINSDILMVLDKSDKTYKVTYKFQPDRDIAMHVRIMQFNDINEDKRPELLIGWAEIGAHWSDTYLTIIKSKETGVKIIGAPKLLNIKYLDSKIDEKVVNKFNRQEEVTSYRSEYFTSKSGSVALINRAYDSCYACGEEDKWTIDYLSLWGDELNQHSTQERDIKGYTKMSEILKNSGYEWK